ncbi:hypothetical protein Tco_0664050 [Tanacetum coccineum]
MLSVVLSIGVIDESYGIDLKTTDYPSTITKNILSVVSVTVQKLHGYGYLEEIVVRRVDRQKYKFKEGDFVNLHMNDIKDMLLLLVQHMLFQLEGDEIVDFITALHIPQKTYPRIEAKELYTPSVPPGVIYEDQDKQNRIMQADELYKFSDGTLKRSGLMEELIGKQLHEREIVRNLERLVGARKLEMEYILMTRME